jgi:hypothetical protein
VKTKDTKNTVVEKTSEATTTNESVSTYGNDAYGIVRTEAAKYGWDTGANWEAIDFIINHESSWNVTAQNPYSTAHGLFQMLTETSNDASVQAVNGMNYISSRYGTPANAYAFWLANNWY